MHEIHRKAFAAFLQDIHEIGTYDGKSCRGENEKEFRSVALKRVLEQTESVERV